MTSPHATPTQKAAPPRAAAERPKDRRLQPAPGASRGARPAKGDGLSKFTTSRTMALGAILACFAASGLLRLGDVVQRGDLAWLTEAREDPAMAKAEAPASVPAPAGKDDAQAMIEDLAQGGAKLRNPGAIESAEDMESALLAMEAAIAAGQFSTASTPQVEADAEAYDKAASRGGEGRARAALPAVGAPGSGEAADLLAALKAREAELDAYAAKLAERNEALSLAAERLETRIRELEQSKEQFSVLVATVDQAATRDVDHLIKMYEKMKPKEAGPLFDAMDPGFAAGFLARMKPDRASAIISKMSTDRAYAVSLQLAGRNVRAKPGAGPARQADAPKSDPKK